MVLNAEHVKRTLLEPPPVLMGCFACLSTPRTGPVRSLCRSSLLNQTTFTLTMREVNMTRKYCIASCTIVLTVDGILSPGSSDRIARKIVNENTRTSNEHISRGISKA